MNKLKITKKLKCINNPLNTYVFLSLIVFVLFSLRVLLSHGLFLQSFFWWDTRDSLMDFFHSIEYTNGRMPYDKFNTLYPPLANLMFWVFFRCVPTYISDMWPQNFDMSIWMRGSWLDLRTYQAPMVCFLMYFAVCIIFTTCILTKLYSEYLLRYQVLGVFLFFNSYGFLMAIERGNIILLVFPFVLFYILYYDSSDRRIRGLAYVSLAIAVGLKIYPGIFYFLLLKERKVKDFIRCMIYCALSVILPMFLFREGIWGIFTWIKIMLTHTNASTIVPGVGNSLSCILENIQTAIFHLTGIDLNGSWYGVASVGVCILLTVISFLLEKKWEVLLSLTLGMTLLSNQGEYIYIFFMVPLLALLIEEEHFNLQNIFPFVALMLIVLPIPLAYVYGVSYPGNVMRQVALIGILVWIVWKYVWFVKRHGIAFQRKEIK